MAPMAKLANRKTLKVNATARAGKATSMPVISPLNRICMVTQSKNVGGTRIMGAGCAQEKRRQRFILRQFACRRTMPNTPHDQNQPLLCHRQAQLYVLLDHQQG